MRQVHTSSLNEIKTVFNSDSDNEQYYDRLKNSYSHKINNVELARPIVRRNNATIIWKAETNLELESFNKLSEDKQAEISFKLRAFFESFKEKINSFRNISNNFADQLIQIPNKNSLLVNEENDYIVIVNWGYLEDAFDPKNDVISKLFAKARSSILIKLINEKDNPIGNVRLKLESESEREFSNTDRQGFARFGTLETGKNFSIYEVQEFDKDLLATFKCDGRNEYCVVKKQRVEIKLSIKTKEGIPVTNKEFAIYAEEFGFNNFKTDALGQHLFSIDVKKGDFELFDENNNKIFTHEIPDNNSTIEITIDDPKVIRASKPIGEDNKNITFQFINSLGWKIKNLDVTFDSLEGNSFSASTNNNGEIYLSNIQSSSIDYSFHRYKKPWRQNILIKDKDYHIVKVRPVFPWIWWILIAILLFFLICCLFFNCFCKNKSIHKTYPPTEVIAKDTIASEDIIYPVVKEVIPCNTHNESGREGVTANQHYLGNERGIVYIHYDMMGVPDKLEVFYEGKLVTSTYDIPHNVDGFVGDDNNSGCCGTLQFQFEPNEDDFCIVRVTGMENTAWEYSIECPR